VSSAYTQRTTTSPDTQRRHPRIRRDDFGGSAETIPPLVTQGRQLLRIRRDNFCGDAKTTTSPDSHRRPVLLIRREDDFLRYAEKMTSSDTQRRPVDFPGYAGKISVDTQRGRLLRISKDICLLIPATIWHPNTESEDGLHIHQ